LGVLLEGAIKSAVASASAANSRWTGRTDYCWTNSIKIGANNVEYSFGPPRTRIKAGTTVTFTNVGDIPHDATSLKQGEWTTGALAKGESKTVTFSKPGLQYYICTPHPWMYGQIIVE
jgi:plastocyanin